MRTIRILLALLVATPTAPVAGGGQVTFDLRGADREAFSHEADVDEALGCRYCHPRLYVDAIHRRRATLRRMDDGPSCGACHERKDARGPGDCSSCHR